MNKTLNKSQQDFLLQTARKAIERFLVTGKTLELITEDRILNEKRGAFVTLKAREQLRGCIGYPLPVKPLLETVIEMALSAATRDYRFQPLNLKELPDTKIEISILSLPRTITDSSEVEVGRHGIIISEGPFQGLLLPQVPVEWGWDRETFLRHGCIKAGLPEDAWKKGAKIQIFSAQVFSE